MQIDVPGAFETYFSGTGVMAGQQYTDEPEIERGARELRVAWLAARRITRGRGYSLRLELPSDEAACVLAEYAMWCLGANADEPEYSEMDAARKVLRRVEKATDGRVRWDGWNVYYHDRVR